MTEGEFSELQLGDIVRPVSGLGLAYVVTGYFGGRAIAVRTADITNPTEWEVVSRASHPNKKGNHNEKLGTS